MKRLFLLWGFLLMAGSATADSVSEEQARAAAHRFFQQNQQTALRPLSRVQLPEMQLQATLSTPALYLFSRTDAPGFVFVAGEDTVNPILGYSFESSIPEDGAMPENLKGWIAEMERQIAWSREQGIQPLAADAEADYGQEVVKLSTALWDQGDPYWNACPIYQGYRCYTGCTNTALAIIMRYHQWPERGSGTLDAYTSSYSNYVIDIPGHTLGHTYDWANMPLDYSQGYTQTQAEAVAQLMYDCGVMLQASYSPEGTGTSNYYIIPELVEHMDYDKSARFVSATSVNSSAFCSEIKASLDGGYPVLHVGYNNEAGHAFVLDGYSNRDYFSVNWGWSGYFNGWFQLSALAPAGSGAGGNNDHYNFNQSALVGLKRNVGGEYELPRLSYAYYIADDISYYGILASDEACVVGKPFRMRCGLLCNQSYAPFSGEIAMAHTDCNYHPKEWLYTIFVSEENPLEFQYGYYDYRDDLVINEPIEHGDKLCLFYKSTTSQEWMLARANEEEGYIWAYPIAFERPLEEVTSVHFDRTSRVLTFETDYSAVGYANFYYGFYQYNSTDGYLFIEDLDTMELVYGEDASLQSLKFTVDTNTLEAGEYAFYLFCGGAIDSYVHFTVGNPSEAKPAGRSAARSPQPMPGKPLPMGADMPKKSISLP